LAYFVCVWIWGFLSTHQVSDEMIKRDFICVLMQLTCVER